MDINFNTCCIMGTGNGNFNHNGWFYSHPVGNCNCGSDIQADPRKKRGLVTAPVIVTLGLLF